MSLIIKKTNDVCEKCNENDYHLDRQIKTCMNCGNSHIVHGDVIDHDGDYTEQHSDDMYLPVTSNSTKMIGNIDAVRVHSWIRIPHNEKAMITIFELMKLRTQNTGIYECVLRKAHYYYWYLQKYNDDTSFILRGKNKNGFIAACVYQGILDENCFRTIESVGKLFDISKSVMINGYKKFIDLCNKRNLKIVTGAIKIENYIESIQDVLDLSDFHLKILKCVCIRIEKINLYNGFHALSIIGGVLIVLSDLYKFDIDINNICLIISKSQSTIIKSKNHILKNLQYIIPKSEKNKLNI